MSTSANETIFRPAPGMGQRTSVMGEPGVAKQYLEKALIDHKPDFRDLSVETFSEPDGTSTVLRPLSQIALEGAITPDVQEVSRAFATQIMTLFGKTLLEAALQKIASNSDISAEVLYDALYDGRVSPPLISAITDQRAPAGIEISTFPEELMHLAGQDPYQ